MVLQRNMYDAELAFFESHAGQPKAQLVKTPEYQQAIAAGWKQGMRDLLLIAANARYFADQAPQVPGDVGNGQAAAGMAIDFYGRVYQETVGPERCRFIAPAAATAITPDPVGILKGVRGERYELALHFVEFLLSRDAQLLWAKKPGTPSGPSERALRRVPIRRDVYADRTGWSDDVNPFVESGGFNQRGEWMAGFSEIRMIWAAAWIDSRPALLDAYHRILTIRDPRRRTRLLTELSNLPIERHDLLDLIDESAKKKPEELAEFRENRRIDFAVTFRNHYQRVADMVDDKKERKARSKAKEKASAG
jgi:hypothetical protein